MASILDRVYGREQPMADNLKNKPAEFEPPKKASPWRRSDGDKDIQKEDSIGHGQNEDDDETQDDLRLAS